MILGLQRCSCKQTQGPSIAYHKLSSLTLQIAKQFSHSDTANTSHTFRASPRLSPALVGLSHPQKS